MTLARLAQSPPAEQTRRLREVPPRRVFDHLGEVDAHAYGPAGTADPAFLGRVDPRSGEAHLRAPARKRGRDYALSLDLADAGGGQIELSFLVVNDLLAPRFDIDVDERGRPTLLGTATRNLPEERRALEAGLGPSQVRRGLRLFAELLPRLEAFAHGLGYVAIRLDPLTYHNAVMYENHGFAYVTGRRRMRAIDAAFAPGGALHDACDGSTPFRRPELTRTARGRSWAIHDGVLTALDGDAALELTMVKVIGEDAGQQTFLTSPAEPPALS